MLLHWQYFLLSVAMDNEDGRIGKFEKTGESICHGFSFQLKFSGYLSPSFAGAQKMILAQFRPNNN